MSFKYEFHSVQNQSDILKTIDFLADQNLSYPGYDCWVQRCEAELFSGYKRAALAFYDDVLIGDIIWQQHKQFPNVRELKNIRVAPGARGRYVGSFLLRQAEYEERESFKALIVDARERQVEVISLFKSMGYIPLGKRDLYGDGQREVILFKDLSGEINSPELFVPRISSSVR